MTRRLHYYVTVHMTDDQEAAYRARHGLDSDPEATYRHLAGTLHEEILGLGVDEGWWTRVSVT